MFYDQLKYLCEKNGVSPTKVTIECGADRSGVTYWKKTGAVPNQKVLNKMAKYFNVSVDYLLNGTNEKPTGKADELIDTLAEEILSLDKEQQEKLIKLLSNEEKLKAVLLLL